MRKLLMITAMVVAFVAPAKATETAAETATRTAMWVATLDGYDAMCGGLSPKMQKLARFLAAGVDPDKARWEAADVLVKMRDAGVQKWCDDMRIAISALEQ
jgi:hypothetical protein